MGLNWNEIKSRALLFSKTWGDACEQATQSVLNVLAQFADASLAGLYDPLIMPPTLLKAHQKLDAAVDAAYQPDGGKKVLRHRRRTRGLPLRAVPTHH
jgi:hypothetical protein